MTTPKEALESALKLEEGKAIKITFKDARRLSSFKTMLYRERSFMEDTSVSISQKNGAILLRKVSEELSCGATLEVLTSAQLSEEDNEDYFEESSIDALYSNTISDKIKNDAKNFKTVDGTRIAKMRKLHSSLYDDKRDRIVANVQEQLAMLSLSDLAEPEKKEKQEEIRYNTNIELEKLAVQTRKEILERL